MITCTVCGRTTRSAWVNPWVWLDGAVGACIKGTFCSRRCLYRFLLGAIPDDVDGLETREGQAVCTESNSVGH
jgi:hypothetical protein